MSDPPMTASATDSNPLHTDVIRLGNLAAFGLMSPTTAHTKTANDTNAMNSPTHHIERGNRGDPLSAGLVAFV